MENRNLRVVIETDSVRIVGDLTLPKEGYRSRLSDFLNHGELDFVPLVNVEMTPLSGGESEAREFVVVARRHIRLAHPAEDGPDRAEIDAD